MEEEEKCKRKELLLGVVEMEVPRQRGEHSRGRDICRVQSGHGPESGAEREGRRENQTKRSGGQRADWRAEMSAIAKWLDYTGKGSPVPKLGKFRVGVVYASRKGSVTAETKGHWKKLAASFCFDLLNLSHLSWVRDLTRLTFLLSPTSNHSVTVREGHQTQQVTV